MFSKYVEDISSTTCLELSSEDISTLRSTCVLSEHAEGRYAERMQEFLRSLTTTNDCLAVKNTRYLLLIGSKQVEISSSYRVIHVTENRRDVARCYHETQPLPFYAIQAVTGMLAIGVASLR
jgi:hypothetical protein